ncbi:hypothetical protein JCM6882_002223 [Rhodosporidiobolus microsporus]
MATTEKSAPPTYQQPIAQAPMMVGGAPPQIVGQNGQPKEWSTGLCACKDDVGGFCLACWCPCITYGQYKQRLDSLKEGRALAKGQAECGTPGWLWCAVNCFSGCGFIFDFLAREEIRKRYNIKEGSAGAFFKTCCCVPCAQRQHHRELLVEEEIQWGAAPQQTQLPQV